MNKLWYLQNINIFQGLKPAELLMLDDQSRHKKYDHDAIIYHPLESEKFVYFLKQGKVKLYRIDNTGRELVTAILKEFEVFGELTTQENAPSNEYAKAVGEVLICRMPRQEFIMFQERIPNLILKINKLLGLRKYELELLIEELVFKSVYQRIGFILLRLYKKFGLIKQGKPVIDMKLTHYDIATMIGATRESVSLEIGKLREQGLIDSDHKHFIIKDPDGLSRAVGL